MSSLIHFAFSYLNRVSRSLTLRRLVNTLKGVICYEGNLPIICNRPILFTFNTTTRCNLRCVICPRTILGCRNQDMNEQVLERLLELVKDALYVYDVGAGEPLLDQSFLMWSGYLRRRGLVSVLRPMEL